MAFTVETMRADCSINDLTPVINSLKKADYYPLVVKINEFFNTLFKTEEQSEPTSKTKTFNSFSSSITRGPRWTRYYFRDYEFTERGIPVAGDLFSSPKNKGLLYLLLLSTETQTKQPRKNEQSRTLLEIGYMGGEDERSSLSVFCDLITTLVSNGDETLTWTIHKTFNQRFEDIIQAKSVQFSSASLVSSMDINYAKRLQDKEVREIATYLRRTGGVFTTTLNSDMAKFEHGPAIVEQLHQLDLLSREYVITCKHKQIQINRVDSLDALKLLSDGGMRCSCGKPIAEERADEILTPNAGLQRMLDKSYWMTAYLVDALRQFGVEDNQIIINLIEGSDEIDTIVSIEDKLMMFELKDKQFSLGDAYNFGARIGYYRPDYAIIVSTSGIAADVKEHFKRVFPPRNLREFDDGSKTTVVYVDTLENLIHSLGELVSNIRFQRAVPIITVFEQHLNNRLSFVRILASKC